MTKKIWKTKDGLVQKIEVRELGESYMVLQVEIPCNREMGVWTVCQSTYAQKIIAQVGLESPKRQNTHMDDNFRLFRDVERSMEP